MLNYCLLTSGQNAEAQCVWSDCGATRCNNDAYPYEWATATCEENFQCLSGSRPRLYCCEVPSPYIDTFWLGTAPFCGVSCNDCKDLNSECIISEDDCGDGTACISALWSVESPRVYGVRSTEKNPMGILDSRSCDACSCWPISSLGWYRLLYWLLLLCQSITAWVDWCIIFFFFFFFLFFFMCFTS